MPSRPMGRTVLTTNGKALVNLKKIFGIIL